MDRDKEQEQEQEQDKEQEKDLQEGEAGEKIVIEHRECTDLLLRRVRERRQPKITDATLAAWDDEVRLMIERDGRSLVDIKTLINECHDMPPQPGTGFTWRDQIRSMATLREKWNDGKIAVGMNKKTETRFKSGPYCNDNYIGDGKAIPLPEPETEPPEVETLL